MKGTGFSPYINVAKEKGFSPRGINIFATALLAPRNHPKTPQTLPVITPKFAILKIGERNQTSQPPQTQQNNALKTGHPHETANTNTH